MELSARDKRILAEIECESAIEDPRWVRRFERLRRHGHGQRHGWRGLGFGALILAAWTAAVVVGAVLLRPLLWAALAAGAVGFAAWLLRRRRVYGYWYRPRRRISRIPEQGAPRRGERGES